METKMVRMKKKAPTYSAKYEVDVTRILLDLIYFRRSLGSRRIVIDRLIHGDIDILRSGRRFIARHIEVCRRETDYGGRGRPIEDIHGAVRDLRKLGGVKAAVLRIELGYIDARLGGSSLLGLATKISGLIAISFEFCEALGVVVAGRHSP